jgi:hypothetical protein
MGGVNGATDIVTSADPPPSTPDTASSKEVKLVKKFEETKEAVDRSATSNDSSKQSQGASNSYPIILATRPPINLATAQPQIEERRLEGKISDHPKKAQGDGPKKAQDGKNATKPPDTTLQTVLTNSGMKNVGNPPSEADLKAYYSKNAPAHELIAKGSYHEAADEYRKLANKAPDPAEQTRLKTVAAQLEVAQTMQTANVKSLQFPPTETNVTDYFKAMKGKPISEIKDAFENYANAFYVHSEENGVDRGDVVYSEHKYKEGNKVYTSNAPVSWKEVTDNREVHSDGRRINDCEGYAYMGQKMLKAAGFENVNFGVTARNPNTAKSLTEHIMVSGSRTIMGEDGKQKTEMAIISNNDFGYAREDGNLKPDAVKNSQTGLFAGAFQHSYPNQPPGLIEVGPEAWREEFELADDINRWQHPAAGKR